jgi:hypothetical protein
MQSGGNISDSVSNETYTAEEVNVLPANQTGQDSSQKNVSISVKQDGHNSSSLDNKPISITPLSRNRKQLDASNDSTCCPNLRSKLRKLSVFWTGAATFSFK